MTRTDYEQSVANKLGIINALKDNVGDEFTALEISAAMIDPPDLKPLQIGAVLKSMVAEGLVSKRPSKNMNVYRLCKKALTWTPPPYDWRAEGAMVTPPESAADPTAAKPPTAGKVNGTPVLVPPATPARKKPKPPASKPADDHPWVHPPAVMPTIPKAAPINRPLPAHLETKADPCHSPASPDPGALDLDADDLAAMALPEAPIAPAFGTGSFLLANPPFEASSQPAVDNSNSPEIPDSSPLPIDSREDEPLAQPEITPAAISGCGGNGECGHCANHAAASELEELAEAQVARLTAQLEIPAWNPLENPDDAFDLMIKLGLRFEYFAVDPFEVSGKPVCVITWAPGGERNRLCRTLTETGDEAHAVVRRAIVRAAAKIGSRMS